MSCHVRSHKVEQVISYLVMVCTYNFMSCHVRSDEVNQVQFNLVICLYHIHVTPCHVKLCCLVLSCVVRSRYVVPYDKTFTWMIETKKNNYFDWLAQKVYFAVSVKHVNICMLDKHSDIYKLSKLSDSFPSISTCSINSQVCLLQYSLAYNICMLGKHSDLFTSISACSVNTQIYLPDVSYGIHYATLNIVL